MEMVFVCKVAAVSWMLLLETGLHCLLIQLSSVHHALQCMWCVCVCICFNVPSLFTLTSSYPLVCNLSLALQSRDTLLTRLCLSVCAHTKKKKRLWNWWRFIVLLKDSSAELWAAEGGCWKGLNQNLLVKSRSSNHLATCILIFSHRATHRSKIMYFVNKPI